MAERKERKSGDDTRRRSTGNGRGRGARRGNRGGRDSRGGAERRRSDTLKKEYRPRHKDDNSIYVGNLSYRTTEMKLGRFFEKYGDIKEVRIAEDANERSRGFGYVEFEKLETVEKALVADG